MRKTHLIAKLTRHCHYHMKAEEKHFLLFPSPFSKVLRVQSSLRATHNRPSGGYFIFILWEKEPTPV